MSSGDTTPKLAWETPSTTPLTDTGSRADEADITLQNAAGSSSIPG